MTEEPIESSESTEEETKKDEQPTENADTPPEDTDESPDETEKDADTDGFQYREKTTTFKAADTERQIAYGVVLTADEVDSMGDFFREDTVNDLAEGFMADMANPDAEPGGPVGLEESGLGGIMHAVFPDDLQLVENTVLDETTTVGTGPAAQEFGPGTWIQGWKITDDSLWQLVTSSTLSGFSIGMWVNEWAEYDPGEMPDDVTVPDAVTEMLADEDLSIDDVYTGEIVSGKVHEVSVVDSPAVPRAQILSHKSQSAGTWRTKADADALQAARESGASYAMAKAAGALTDSFESCVSYLRTRGHSEEEAAALATYLQRVIEEDGTAVSEKSNSGLFGRAKSFVGLGADTESAEAVTVGTPTVADQSAEKAGRTLSERNAQRMMVLHDLTLSVLRDADMDGGRMTFAADPEYDSAVDPAGLFKTHSEAPMGAADTESDSPRGAVPDADSTSELSMNNDELTDKFDTLEASISDLSETVESLAADAAEDDTNSDEKSVESGEFADDTPSREDLVEQAAEQAAERVLEAQADADSDDEEPTAADVQERVAELAQNQQTLNENQQALNESLAELNELTGKIADADGVSQQTPEKAEPSDDNTGSEKATLFGLSDD